MVLDVAFSMFNVQRGRIRGRNVRRYKILLRSFQSKIILIPCFIRVSFVLKPASSKEIVNFLDTVFITAIKRFKKIQLFAPGLAKLDKLFVWDYYKGMQVSIFAKSIRYSEILSVASTFFFVRLSRRVIG